MRVVVAGGREFTNRELLFATLDQAFGAVLNKIVVISGHARGVDVMGEEWAKSRGLSVEAGTLIVMPADWEKYGKSAGHRRNREMGDLATHLVLFWDGKSAGSRGMLEYAMSKSLWIKVVRY